MTLQRLRYNFITGSITSITTTGASGVATFANINGLGNITVTNGTQYLPLSINPASYSSSAPSEIVWVTSYIPNSSTANVLRAQEGTSNGGTWAGAAYTHSPTTLDFDVSNLSSTGTLNLNNGVVSTTISGTSLNVTGNIVANGNITASGSASGFTSYATIGNTGFYSQYGNAVIGGTVQGTTISGTTFNVGNTINVGNAANIAGEIYANNTGTAISAPNGNIVTNGMVQGATISGTTTDTNNLVVTNNAVVNGTLTTPTRPLGTTDNTVATTQYVANGTGVFGTSGSAGIVPISIGQIALITISGYNKYLIHGDLTITNNDSSGHIAYLQLNIQYGSSGPANSTYITAGNRGYIGTSWIVSGNGTGTQTIQLQAYIGGSQYGTSNNYDIYAIGLT